MSFSGSDFVEAVGLMCDRHDVKYEAGDDDRGMALLANGVEKALVERVNLRKALQKIVDAGDGIATINAVAEARGLLEETTLAWRLAKVGFAVWESGGGCTAWRVPLPHGYILITTDDGSDHDVTFDKPSLLGIYDNDDQAVAEVWRSHP